MADGLSTHDEIDRASITPGAEVVIAVEYSTRSPFSREQVRVTGSRPGYFTTYWRAIPPGSDEPKRLMPRAVQHG